MGHGFHNPSLTVAIAMVAGILAQAAGRKLRIPGLVLLLLVGVLLGPDALHAIDPSLLGSGLQILVGFAVAIILFEGGMGLNVRRLLRAQRPVRNLVTIGAAVTALGGTLAARLCMGWGWTLSILFGTLVIVTGPTVITPLLRRLKVEHRVATVLEAEGVLIDPIGAITAAVVVEVALYPSQSSISAAFINAAGGLGFGVAFGLLAGLFLVFILRRDFMSRGLENVFTLGYVLALFQLSNTLVHESGIAAVTTAGIMVGRAGVSRDLHEFKEQLTAFVIGMLFVLLAANVRLAEVGALGWAGVATVLALMLVVRPVNVLIGTWGSDLGWRRKLFMSWIGPRGIIAAAISSLFALKMSAAGMQGGNELQALVFLVIASTVLAAGLTGGLVARVLGLKRKVNDGWIILGANDLGRMMARMLGEAGETVVVIESDPNRIRLAERDGLRVVFGNPLEERTLLRAGVDSRAGVVALTASEEGNFLFAQKVRKESAEIDISVALDSLDQGVTAGMVRKAGANVVFGSPQPVDLWSVRIRRKAAVRETWRYEPESAEEDQADGEPRPSPPPEELATGRLLPMLRIRDGAAVPISSATFLEPGDEVVVLILEDRREVQEQHMRDLGFVR